MTAADEQASGADERLRAQRASGRVRCTAGSRALVLRAEEGDLLSGSATRWFEAATPAERSLLARLPGPVLDVGCGPGRLVVALLELGVPALGVDNAPGAVAMARAQGATAVARSVFDRLPAEGRWGSGVLADGNVGIGGDPIRLLARIGHLVRPGGTIVVETDPRASGIRRGRARLERGSEVGGWFAWAVVGPDALPALARASGLVHRATRQVEGRPFGLLARPLAEARAAHQSGKPEARAAHQSGGVA